MEEIKIGDLVKLKSGGPTMTVIEKIPEISDKSFYDYVLYPDYNCKWFDENEKKYKVEVFNKKLLQKID